MKRAEAAIVEVGGGWRNFGDFELGVGFFLEEGDAIPMNFEGLGEAKALGAGGKFAFEIDEDGFCFAGGRADCDVDGDPFFGSNFGFENWEWKWEGWVLRCGHVGHAAAEAEPAV